MSLANKTKMSLTNKLVSYKERITIMIKAKAYTDCTWCRSSFEISEFAYNYLCNGGQADMLCDDCYGEEQLLVDADMWA